MSAPAGRDDAALSGATGNTRILGIPIDRVTRDQAVAWILKRAAGKGGAGESGRTRLVVTANPEMLMAARGDAEIRRILEQADLAFADGIGLVLAARLLGTPLPGRVPGIEVLEELLDQCARRGLRPYFLGAAPDVVETAARRAGERYPGLRLAGLHDGYFPLDDPGPVRAVAASGADILFSGMGAGRDLRWLFRHRDRLGVPVAMGVGGSFDVLAGRIARAPAWMRRIHLEWAYRLLQEPGRWRRQKALPRFLLAVLAERLRGRRP